MNSFRLFWKQKLNYDVRFLIFSLIFSRQVENFTKATERKLMPVSLNDNQVGREELQDQFTEINKCNHRLNAYVYIILSNSLILSN